MILVQYYLISTSIFDSLIFDNFKFQIMLRFTFYSTIKSKIEFRLRIFYNRIGKLYLSLKFLLVLELYKLLIVIYFQIELKDDTSLTPVLIENSNNQPVTSL